MSSRNQVLTNNTNSFPNNNSGQITPQVLRDFNADFINSTVFLDQTSSMAVASASYANNATSASFATTAVSSSFATNATSASYALTASFALNTVSIDTGSFVTTSSFNSFSSSISDRVEDLEQFSASLDATFATDAQLSALSASIALTDTTQSIQIAALQQFSSSLDATFATDAQLNAVTASLNALSSSYIATSGSVNQLLAFSSSLDATFATDAELNAATASLSGSIAALSSSFLSTSSSLSAQVGALTAATSSYVNASITGSSLVTASVNVNVLTFTKGDGSIFNLTVQSSGSVASASYADFAVSASNANLLDGLDSTAFVLNSQTSSMSVASASVATTAISASQAQNAVTASYVLNAVSASFATNAATATSASFATNAGAAATATSASFATNAASADTATSASFATTASFATNAATAATATSASNAAAVTLATDSNNSNRKVLFTNGTTDSTGNQVLIDSGTDFTYNPSTDRLTVTNLSVPGTASFGYVQTVTGSAVIIGQEFIILNANPPTARYAGIKVYDTGSALTASLQWDGDNDNWIVVEETGLSAGILTGPTGSLGGEVFPTNNTLIKGTGHHTVGNSNITDNGSIVSINSNTQITGSLNVTAGITGSLNGTASFATQAANATTASYVLNAVSASFATSASVAVSASFATNSISSSFASNSTSASYAINATSASYADNAGVAQTATSASFATSASQAQNAVSASFATNTGNAISASYALSASRAENSGLLNNFSSSQFARLAATQTFTGQNTYTNANPIYMTSGSLQAGFFQVNTLFLSNTSNREIGLSADLTKIGATGGTTQGIYASDASLNYRTAIEIPTGAGVGKISNKFNTEITGSLTVMTGSNIELRVEGTGVTLGNILTDTHRVTGSLNITGSLTLNGSPVGGAAAPTLLTGSGANSVRMDVPGAGSSTAGGLLSMAIGVGAIANGVAATAYGYNARVENIYGTALGAQAEVFADNGQAFGKEATVNSGHTNSTAIGYLAKTTAADQTYIKSKTTFLSGSLTVNAGPSVITGSLTVTQGVTASLQGTASYATQALSASYAPVSIDTSAFATTGSNTFNGNQIISGSLDVVGAAIISDPLYGVEVDYIQALNVGGVGYITIGSPTQFIGTPGITGSLSIAGGLLSVDPSLGIETNFITNIVGGDLNLVAFPGNYVVASNLATNTITTTTSDLTISTNLTGGGAKISIGQPAVPENDIELNATNVTVNGTFAATGSLNGTASFAVTASYALNGGGGGGVAASDIYSYTFLLMGA